MKPNNSRVMKLMKGLWFGLVTEPIRSRHWLKRQTAKANRIQDKKEIDSQYKTDYLDQR